MAPPPPRIFTSSMIPSGMNAGLVFQPKEAQPLVVPRTPYSRVLPYSQVSWLPPSSQ
jgi:hypothetical protein